MRVAFGKAILATGVLATVGVGVWNAIEIRQLREQLASMQVEKLTVEPATPAPPLVSKTPAEYLVEPLDVLTIEARLNEVKVPPQLLNVREMLRTNKDEDGKDLTADRRAKLKREKAALETDKVEYTGKTNPLPHNPIQNQFQVRPDGTVYLGAYGTVSVAGLTTNQAQLAIRSVLAKQINHEAGGTREDSVLVLVDVVQYNSKTYYVITDGGEADERVAEFPITGKEFVSSAIARIGGLPEEASKRNIWVQRHSPTNPDGVLVLPVDWVGITQLGLERTNYQLRPGDRVHVKTKKP